MTLVIALTNGQDVIVKSIYINALINLMNFAELNETLPVTIMENKITEIYNGRTRLEGCTFAPRMIESVFLV